MEESDNSSMDSFVVDDEVEGEGEEGEEEEEEEEDENMI